MAKEQTSLHWSKEDALKSILLFLAQSVLLIAITAGVVAFAVPDIQGAIKERGTDYLYTLFCMILLVCILYFYFFFENRDILSSGKKIALIFLILDLYILIAYLLQTYVVKSIYARPVAFVALMTFVLVGRKEAIFLNVISALMMLVIDTFAFANTQTSSVEACSSLIIAFSAGMFAIFLCEKATTRFRIILVGIFIVIPIDCITLLLGVSSLIGGSSGGGSPWNEIFGNMGYGLAGGVMSTVFFLTILPIFEGAFNCLTVFRLRELTSPDAKVLKRLNKEAPGTYNHCMMVAQLAEACASAIGENVDYARAAALYHDVGKLHHPEYFTENQGDYNLHDELLPELSADMIRSHATDGYALIRKNHLPDFLADVALQHHGTLPIRYFYAKALKLTDGELNIEDFSYAGPKPQTKIAAIIMIADASEAVARATGARTPDAAEKVIRGIIEERMDLEQFSECDITMVDLTKIRLALVNALTGVYHHRIKYPNIKYKQSGDGKMKGENA